MRLPIAFAIAASLLLAAAAAAAQDQELPGTLTQLTYEYQAGYPDWSPDGEYVVFTSEWSEEERIEGNLWRLPVDGGERMQLTTGGGHHGVFSPDGRYIAFDALEGSQVRLIPAAGGVPVRIVPESIPVVHSGNPAWSPDGRRIAFRSENDVYLLDLPTGEFTLLYHRDGEYPMPIEWAPAGGYIVCAFINPEAREAELWQVFLDGSDPVQLTFDCHCTQGTLSPDGRFLLYSATVDGSDYDLWLREFASGKLLHLTSDGYWDVEPCWSPVANRIVFSTSRADRFDLWIWNLDMGWIEAELAKLNGST